MPAGEEVLDTVHGDAEPFDTELDDPGGESERSEESEGEVFGKVMFLGDFATAAVGDDLIGEVDSGEDRAITAADEAVSDEKEAGDRAEPEEEEGDGLVQIGALGCFGVAFAGANEERPGEEEEEAGDERSIGEVVADVEAKDEVTLETLLAEKANHEVWEAGTEWCDKRTE